MVRFFLFEFNCKTERTRIIDTNICADVLWQKADSLQSNSRNHLNYYVGLWNSSKIQNLVDNKLLDCCNSVANCLYFAERAFLRKRSRHGTSHYWLNKAYETCEFAAKYLE